MMIYVRYKILVKSPPNINPKITHDLDSFTYHDREKFLISSKSLKDGSFAMTSLDYFETIDKQFDLIQGSLSSSTSKMNINVEEIFTTLKMLELEKNKIKIELGNCKDISIDDEFDTASVWESVSLISYFLTSKLQLSDESPLEPDPDKLSHRIFEAHARKKLTEHQSLFSQAKTLKFEFQNLKRSNN